MRRSSFVLIGHIAQQFHSSHIATMEKDPGYNKHFKIVYNIIRQGIGSQLMIKMLELLIRQGYERASLAVQKTNYAVKMYENAGLKTVGENTKEYIMVCEL